MPKSYCELEKFVALPAVAMSALKTMRTGLSQDHEVYTPISSLMYPTVLSVCGLGAEA